MPRKTAAAVFRVAMVKVASMRPRPDAAENIRYRRPSRTARTEAASMRPRPDAAENLDHLPLTDAVGELASMRPRPDAAENARTPTTGSAAQSLQ